MTLDEAIDAFKENPCDKTAVDLRSTAQEYARDEMITEEEMWELIASTEEIEDDQS